MNRIKLENYEFLTESIGKAKIVMPTAENKLDFNINSQESFNNISKLKEWFGLNEVGYLRQVHSDVVHIFYGNVYVGDALITDKKLTAIGVFTADCVPVLIYDCCKQVIAAVHSGWKGTLACIAAKTIETMNEKYSCDPSNMSVYIGPHIGKCCYEVGDEIIKLFSERPIYKNIEFSREGKLDLEACIIKQLTSAGVSPDNIKSVNICTLCSTDVKMHSYRKSRDESGRMFSFLYME